MPGCVGLVWLCLAVLSVSAVSVFRLCLVLLDVSAVFSLVSCVSVWLRGLCRQRLAVSAMSSKVGYVWLCRMCLCALGVSI